MVQKQSVAGRSVLLLIGVVVAVSCDNIKQSPQGIEADGQTYIACHDLVWIDNEGGGILGGETTFKVSYTDAQGLAHTVKGIKKLSIHEVPKVVPSSLPYPLPDPKTGTDRSGNAFREGVVYTWSDGSEAVLQNGLWKPTMRLNKACQAE